MTLRHMVIESKCFLCKGYRKLTLDHDHKTYKIRGTLCHECNVALGFIETRGIEWLEKALHYMITDYNLGFYKDRNKPLDRIDTIPMYQSIIKRFISDYKRSEKEN